MTKKAAIYIPLSSASLLEANDLSPERFYKMAEETEEFFEELTKKNKVDITIRWEIVAFLLGLEARDMGDTTIFAWVADKWRQAMDEARDKALADGVVGDDLDRV